MILNIKNELNKNIYKTTFTLLETTPSEDESIKDFGDELVNVGGDIIDTNTSDVLFKQGDKFIKFPSDLPFVREFNNAILGGQAEDIALEYVKMIEYRMIVAGNAINARVDTFSRDEDIVI